MPRPRRLSLTIQHVWVGLTLAAAFIGPASSPLQGPDVYWTMLSGAWMSSNGRLLDSDPFTAAPHVAGPFLNVQWLADLIYYGLTALGGLPLVITGTAVVITITFALLLQATIVACGQVRVSCVAVWLAYVLAASNLTARPQTLAYPLFALFVLAVARVEWRTDTRLLWLLPPATALWANLHGSFFTGLLLLGCAAAARVFTSRRLFPARPYLLALGACLLASLINPYGIGALAYLLTIASNPVIRDVVSEWMPTTVRSLEGVAFFASLVVLAALALQAPLRLTAFEVLALLVFGVLAWSSVRAVIWWGMVMTPILARLLGSVLSRSAAASTRDVPVLNGVILAALVGLAVLSLPWFKTAITVLPADKRGLLSPDTPVGVGAYLQTHDPPPGGGRMFNTQAWGGYLEWAAWPRHQVFVDGRFELYPPQVWFDYLEMVFPSTRWRDLMDQYRVTYAVLSKDENGDLVTDLRADRAWQLDYEDDQAAVFSRTLPSNVP